MRHVPALLTSPWHVEVLVPLVLGASSITSLLFYFYGIMEMGHSIRSILLPAVAVLVLLIIWAKRTQRTVLYSRMLAGLWAGAVATFAYDLVRVPIVWSGLPVFKAISYFGTVITTQTSPSVPSEVVGWAYHLSNGIGFGLMYAMVVPTPRWWTAVLWGLLLEGAMLVTPYAEVLGYKVSSEFLAITIGAHVVYGFTLWAGLAYWWRRHTSRPSSRRFPACFTFTWVLVPLGIGAIAADFHWRYGATLPPSPPAYVGPHLYTTWDVLEPDRLAAMWVLQRFIDPRARFHFVPPFSSISYGTLFDTPEATIRRRSTQSVTEVLLAQHQLDSDTRLGHLARMTHLYEITPWMRPTDPIAYQFGQELLAATGHCEPQAISRCVEQAFRYLDTWYTGAS